MFFGFFYRKNEFKNRVLSNNIAGIYFLLIRHSHETKSIKLKETSTCSIFVLYCNDEFLDAGPPLIGNCHEEYEEVISILKNAFR